MKTHAHVNSQQTIHRLCRSLQKDCFKCNKHQHTHTQKQKLTEQGTFLQRELEIGRAGENWKPNQADLPTTPWNYTYKISCVRVYKRAKPHVILCIICLQLKFNWVVNILMRAQLLTRTQTHTNTHIDTDTGAYTQAHLETISVRTILKKATWDDNWKNAHKQWCNGENNWTQSNATKSKRADANNQSLFAVLHITDSCRIYSM